MPIRDNRYKCDNCFDFDFCETCHRNYVVEKKELKTIYSTSHKGYHTFSKFMLSAAPPVISNQQRLALDNGPDDSKLIDFEDGKG